jgi:transposase-like protein
MMPQRKVANSSCMGVVKAMKTGSKLKRSARANATFQVMQISEVLNVSWSSVLQWVLPSVGA